MHGAMTVTPLPTHSPIRGILLILAAVLVFACMDTAGKYLMTKFNVPLVAAVRYGLNLLILLVILAPVQGRKLWQTQRTGLVVLRAVSLAAATFFAGLALQRMPVGESVAIFYLQGFGIILAGGYFLGERMTLAGWAAATVGFAGVLLIARPSGALDPFGVAFALICSGVSVVYVLLSRALRTTESTMALLFHVALAGTIGFGILLAFNWKDFVFTWMDLGLLFFLGAGSLAAHYLFTSAYRFAPASQLAPFNYFHIALAVVMGWIIYDHVPDLWSFIGMAMIAMAGAAFALYSHFTKSKEAQ
jgi:drug/metabolite transporter (DMT)-like permease